MVALKFLPSSTSTLISAVSPLSLSSLHSFSYKMRFSVVALLTIAVGIAVASPLPDVVSEVGNAVHSFDDASGVTDTEDIINAYSNDALNKVEDKTGITYAEEVLHLERKRATKGDLQSIGKGVKFIKDGTGVS